MYDSKKSNALMKSKLTGSLKKNGFELYRFVFNAQEKVSGIEKSFFIECALINPYLNPEKVVLGFTPRVKINSEDLQNVLTGTKSAQDLQSETMVTPSYISVRCGTFGSNAKQVSAYFSAKSASISSKSHYIETENFKFADGILSGKIDISSDASDIPAEYLCDSGSFSWSLRYEKRKSFFRGYKSKYFEWCVPGAKTVFAGNITMDGKEFSVLPKKSFGYIEHLWGKEILEDWFHISSSNLISNITGTLLQNSCFSIYGVFEDGLSFLADIDDKQFEWTADKNKRTYNIKWDVVEVPDSDMKKLHWSASANNKKYVIDVDVFCLTEQLSVHLLEKTEGNRKILKILSGANATGEIRLYKKVKKNLELIEDAKILSSLAEFGKSETQDE